MPRQHQPKAAPKAKAGRPTKYETRFCVEVIECMRLGYSLGAFAGKIGVARSTINEWMGEHAEFSEAVSCAKGERLYHWESAALKVAEKGGGPGTATVIVFGLKNMGDDDWCDRQEHQLTGKDGGPIETQGTVDVSHLTAEQLRALASVRLRADG